MQAIILAGGKGTRLASRLNGRPKPLVDVCGVPLLERQLAALEDHGFDEVVLLVNHRADLITDFVINRKGRISIKIFDDGEPRGTAGALLAAMDHLREQFFVIYGDTLFDIDFGHMLKDHVAHDAEVTLFLHPNDHPADSDLVETDSSGRIRKFHGYPHPDGANLGNLVNAALYVCEKRAFVNWRNTMTPSDLAKDLFPEMLNRGTRLQGYRSFEYIKDLGTPARLDKVERHLTSGLVARSSRRHLQKAVFVDRDGTLNALNGYVRRPEDLQIFDNAARSVRQLNEAEYRVVVVTNQPVLARGECDEEMMRLIHQRLSTQLGSQGAYLDDIRVCPHHPNSGFPGEVATLKCVCDCRKPAVGMLTVAARDMQLDLSQSWMVGDSTVDMACAKAAGVTSILVMTGEKGRDGRCISHPDFVVADIEAAAKLITELVPSVEANLRNELAPLPAGTPLNVVGAAEAQSMIRAILRRTGVLNSIVNEMPSEDGAAKQGDAMGLSVDADYWVRKLS